MSKEQKLRVLQATATYLSKRPYDEVFQLIGGLTEIVKDYQVKPEPIKLESKNKKKD